MKRAHLSVAGRATGIVVSITETRRERLRGLLGCDTLAAGEALLLQRCGSVHTFGMRFAIDILFVDRQQRIVAIHHDVPRRRLRAHLRAVQTLEMPAGAARRHRFACGDQLAFEATP